MNAQRTISILLPDDVDLRATLEALRSVQNAVSAVAFNGGKPLRAVELPRVVYDQVNGTLTSQMTITALRLVVGASASAKGGHDRGVRLEAPRRARDEATGWTYKPHRINPVGVARFARPAALLLVGERGREADFRADGTLAIWTVAGRKRLAYTVPPTVRPLFAAATAIDSVRVIERTGRLYGGRLYGGRLYGGRLYGRAARTLDAPEPKHPRALLRWAST